MGKGGRSSPSMDLPPTIGGMVPCLLHVKARIRRVGAHKRRHTLPFHHLSACMLLGGRLPYAPVAASHHRTNATEGYAFTGGGFSRQPCRCRCPRPSPSLPHPGDCSCRSETPGRCGKRTAWLREGSPLMALASCHHEPSHRPHGPRPVTKPRVPSACLSRAMASGNSHRHQARRRLYLMPRLPSSRRWKVTLPLSHELEGHCTLGISTASPCDPRNHRPLSPPFASCHSRMGTTRYLRRGH